MQSEIAVDDGFWFNRVQSPQKWLPMSCDRYWEAPRASNGKAILEVSGATIARQSALELAMREALSSASTACGPVRRWGFLDMSFATCWCSMRKIRGCEILSWPGFKNGNEVAGTLQPCNCCISRDPEVRKESYRERIVSTLSFFGYR